MSVKNLRQRKSELRSRYKKLRESFGPNKKKQLDSAITRRLLDLDEYKNAESVFAFISKDIEVDTEAIIADAFKSGKRVAVPLCEPETATIEFYYIKSRDDLKAGYYGILEPDADKCEKADTAPIMIVPGLVFDRSGYRLGFGKGYYDRYLADFKGVTIGVCYSEAIENELPLGRYDRPIDLVVTDKYIIHTS